MELFKKIYRAQKKSLFGFNDEVGLLAFIYGKHVQAFDCRQISEVIAESFESFLNDIDAGDVHLKEQVFAPAEITWLEFSDWVAVLKSTDDGGFVPVICTKDGAKKLNAVALPNNFPLKARQTFAYCMCALYLINTPNTVTETNRAGKVKQRKSQSDAPAFHTGEYEVVKLCIDGEVFEEGEQQGSTGMRPHHFVRAHKRIVNGVEYHVRWHWRGNKNIGTKNKIYEPFTKENSET